MGLLGPFFFLLDSILLWTGWIADFLLIGGPLVFSDARDTTVYDRLFLLRVT